VIKLSPKRLFPNLTSTFELFIHQEMRSTKVKATKIQFEIGKQERELMYDNLKE